MKSRSATIPSKDLNVLAISYGRNLFNSDNSERGRMLSCAKEVGSYHMIVFTSQSDGLSTQSEGNLTLHPTNSKSKLHMLFDAYLVGKRILKNSNEQWVITSQDPFEAGLIGNWLSRKFNLPLNIQEHGDFFSTKHWSEDRLLNRVRRVVGKYLLKRADSVRVVSQRIKRTLIDFGVKEQNILLLPVRSDAISTTTNSTGENLLRKRWPNASVIVLSMGRLVSQKNLPMLLMAFAKLWAVDDRARLAIVGEGELRESLQQLAKNLNIASAVEFLPWTDDPAALLAEVDIYALSSNWEGWARVLVEAMAAGVPVVTTDVGCAGEVLLDGQHGYVVPIGDENEFTEKLIKLAGDAEVRQRLGDQARTDSKKVHQSIEEYAADWAEVLKQTANWKNHN